MRYPLQTTETVFIILGFKRLSLKIPKQICKYVIAMTRRQHSSQRLLPYSSFPIVNCPIAHLSICPFVIFCQGSHTFQPDRIYQRQEWHIVGGVHVANR